LEDEYDGFRINILATLDNNKTYVAIDLTVGDIITPRAMVFSYNSIFEDKKILIMTYTLETVLAEKFQTIINRGVLNTRMKDYNDIYFLMNEKEFINQNNLISAINNTFTRRETKINTDEFKVIIKELKENVELRSRWKEFQNKVNYKTKVDYGDVMAAIEKIIVILETKN